MLSLSSSHIITVLSAGETISISALAELLILLPELTPLSWLGFEDVY